MRSSTSETLLLIPGAASCIMRHMAHLVRGRRAVVLTALLLLHATPWLMRPRLIGGDEPHYALMTYSLAVDHDIDLTNNYREVAEGSAAAGVKRAGQVLEPHIRRYRDREVFSHPLGLPLFAAPLIAVQQLVAPGSAPDVPLGLLSLAITFLGLLAGRSLLERTFGVGDLAFGIYFSTPLWFTSRTFFTEPFIWSSIVIGLWLFARFRTLTSSWLMAAAVALKESAMLAVGPIIVGVLAVHGRRRGLRMITGVIVVAAVWMVKNMIVYGSPIVTFQPYRVADPLHGLLGVLFDSRHGMVPFAPIVVIAAAGIPSRRPIRRLLADPVTIAWLVIIGFVAVTAGWARWDGGSCFGPRLLIPAIAAAAVPIAAAWCRHRHRRWFRALSGGLLVGGFTVQLCAALDPAPAFWSPSVGELLTANPIATVAGLAIGTWLTAILVRRLMREPNTDPT